MIKIILIVFFIVFLILKIIQFFKRNKHAKKMLLTAFRAGNVCVAGCKGTGKDMLFYNVIRLREKENEPHAGNIFYNPRTKIRPIKHYRLYNNTTLNFIDNDFKPEIKRFQEKEDYYISDCGLALPAWQRQRLEKDFPTFPIVYALSRQLADFNIHANAQVYGLIWDKLRNQANYFITCLHCKVVGRLVRQEFIIYSRQQSAEENIMPFIVRKNFLGIKNRNDLATAQLFNAKNGYIERLTTYFILPKNEEMYDTRQYHKTLYGEKAPDIKKINNFRKAKKRP